MKKIILMLFLFYFTFSQGQWTFITENDPFDGTELLAIGEGYGGDFPYEKPNLVFRKNLKENKLDVIVIGAGYAGYSGQNRVDFSFGNSDEVLSFNALESVSGDSVFIDFTVNELLLKLNTLINNLKSKNIVYIEFRNNSTINRFRIRLNGSSSVISKVLGDFMQKRLKQIEDENKNAEREIKEKEEQEMQKRLKDFEGERKKQEAIRKKLKDDNARKNNLYNALFKDIEGVIIKPSVSALDEIMEEQYVNYTRPPLNRLKSGHSMLDIDKISLSPTPISCVYNIVVYDYDLPLERQAFLSSKKISLNKGSCDALNTRLNVNTQLYEVVKINENRVKKGEGGIVITDKFIEFMLPASSNSINPFMDKTVNGKHYFVSKENGDLDDTYYFPTSKTIKKSNIIVTRGEREKTITFQIETASPYTNKELKILVRKKRM